MGRVTNPRLLFRIMKPLCSSRRSSLAPALLLLLLMMLFHSSAFLLLYSLPSSFSPPLFSFFPVFSLFTSTSFCPFSSLPPLFFFFSLYSLPHNFSFPLFFSLACFPLRPFFLFFVVPFTLFLLCFFFFFSSSFSPIPSRPHLRLPFPPRYQDSNSNHFKNISFKSD